MNHQRISVVIPCYQQGRYLSAAIESVLSQGYPNLELIVMDGGSTDNTLEIIHHYQRHLFYWTSGPDGGQTNALISGFQRATGDILGWLCSDDLLLPGSLSRVNRYLYQHQEIDAIFGDAVWIDAAGYAIRAKKEMRFSRLVLLYDHNYLPQPSTFWRRHIFDLVGRLNPEFNLAMDADLWSRIARAGRIDHIASYLSCMRWYPEQKTQRLRPQALKEESLIRARDGYGWPALFERHLLRATARLTRIIFKAVAGGYQARLPKQIIEEIERYIIVKSSAG